MRNFKKSVSVFIVLLLAFCLTTTCFAYNISDSLINAKWIANSGANGFLGNATTDTYVTPNNLGVYNHFQGGSIYRKYTFNEAYTVYGLIRDKWAQLGWENSFLGFPVTDELDACNQAGRYNDFEGGTILYKWGAPAAYEVHGCIRDMYSWMGWEASPLGFPTTDEYGVNGKRASHFEKGAIYYRDGQTWPVMTSESYGPGYPFGNQRLYSVAMIQHRFSNIITYNEFAVRGEGFGANKRVNVYLSSVSSNLLLGTADTNGSGEIDFFTTTDPFAIPTSNQMATIWVTEESGGPIAICSYKPIYAFTTQETALD